MSIFVVVNITVIAYCRACEFFAPKNTPFETLENKN